LVFREVIVRKEAPDYSQTADILAQPVPEVWISSQPIPIQIERLQDSASQYALLDEKLVLIEGC
jgi:hypothetical protein